MYTKRKKLNLWKSIVRIAFRYWIGREYIFFDHSHEKSYCGLIPAIPTEKVGDENQTFDISPIARSLNGENFTMLLIAKPISNELIIEEIGKLSNIKDNCFAVSKRNVSRQKWVLYKFPQWWWSYNSTDSTSESITKSKSKNKGISIVILNSGNSKSKSKHHPLLILSLTELTGTTLFLKQ